MKITLQEGQFGWDYLIVAEDGQDILIQTDWEYPEVARTFGWETPEGKALTASEEIALAQQFLDDNIGAEAEDPGYFDVSRSEPEPEEPDMQCVGCSFTDLCENFDKPGKPEAGSCYNPRDDRDEG